MGAILALTERHGIPVIEDAAHAIPAFRDGRAAGSIGTAGALSFYATKTVTTGEGGMLLTDSDAIADRARVMRLHGISRDAFDRYTSKTPAWYYEVVAPGYKYNMPDTAAAMGIHQLKKINAFLAKRETLAARYDEALADLPLILPARPVDAGSNHAWHLYPVRLKPEAGISRDDFIVRMAELGIGCSVHFIPLHRQPVWRDGYSLKREDFPVADAAFEAEVTLPLYTRMTDDDQRRVIAAVREVLGQ
jgi:dTDP-4-amino-4,6-dideoxygalactose transaminase